MKRMRMVSTALAVVAVLAATACSSSSGSGGSSSGSSASSSGPSSSGGSSSGSSASAPSPSDRELRIAVAGEPANIDLLPLGELPTEVVGYNVYETLTRISNDGKVMPWLATSWEMDGDSFVVKLRQGVKFHDGTDFTSEDVVASINKAVETKASVARGLSKAEAIDPYTVRISSDSANPEVPFILSGPPMEPSERIVDGSLANEMVGTGPYKWGDWQRGESMTFTRNDDYWGDKGEYSKVTWFFRPEASVRIDMLKAGEVDAVEDVPPGTTTADVPNQVSAARSSVLLLRVKFADGYPLANAKLREAVVHALDLNQIVDGIYEGQGAVPNGQAVIPSVFGYNPDLKDATFDPDLSKQILQQENAVGTKISVDAADRWTRAAESQQAVVAMLRDVGFDVTTVFEDQVPWRAKVNGAREFGGRDPRSYTTMDDLTMTVRNSPTLTAASVLQSYMCDEGTQQGGCDDNYSNIVKQALATSDLDAREKLYQQAFAAMQTDGVVIPLVALGQTHGLAADFTWDLGQDYKIFIDQIHVKS